MSAFLCSEKHISSLVSAACLWRSRQSIGMDWESTFRALVDENVASLRARYGEGEAMQGECDAAAKYRWQSGAAIHMQPVQILKALACYEYQSCEHDGWQTSAVKRFCDGLRYHAIANLPGYESAAWEVR